MPLGGGECAAATERLTRSTTVPLLVEDDRLQRATTLLRDIGYVIEAHFVLTAAAEARDTQAKHLSMFNRRASRGQCFHRPCLGARKWAADFAPVETAMPMSTLPAGSATATSGGCCTTSTSPTAARRGSSAKRFATALSTCQGRTMGGSTHDTGALGTDYEFEPESRLEIDTGYGFGLAHGRGVLTPYAGITLGDAGNRTVRTGTRWQLGPDIVVGVEATRQTSDAGETDNQLMLRAALRFWTQRAGRPRPWPHAGT